MNVLKTTVAATVFCLITSVSWAAGLSAQVNSSQIAQGDSFQLMLTAQSPDTAPDLTPLAEDFDVLGTSQSSQTQIINGQMSQSVSWIVTLSPQTLGPLTIPTIQAGALSSDPIDVQVLDASQLPKLQGTTGIVVDAAIDGMDHYQFQEIPLTVRIETAQPLQSADLIAPTGDFELTPTGQDRRSQITRDGHAVTVVERDYLLRPQTTGVLTVPPFTLQGAVNDPNARRSAFGARDPFAMMDQMMAQMGGPRQAGSPFDAMFNPGQPFVARSDAITLDVLANPNAGTSDWFLPAKAVELRSAWQPETPTFREGEAVTRKISVLALGARPEQLPNLTFGDPVGARIYVDSVDTDMMETADGTVARRDFNLSIVPTQGGDITLPEVAVEWLDTASGETRTATLAAMTISVEGIPPAAQAQPLPLEPAQVSTRRALPKYGLGALALLALLGAGFAIHKGKTGADQPKAAAPTSTSKDISKGLRKAADNGDQQAFYTGLLKLQTRAKPHERQKIDQAIAQLDRVTYASDRPKDPVDLKAVLQGLSVRQFSVGKFLSWSAPDNLPALYPHHQGTGNVQ
ncbi:BatD family protein [Octadecabacter sp.]|nr:BatD family protein [Octadecabacter sp.]